jgi:hypothetical protein
MLRKIPNPNKIPIPMRTLDLLGFIGIIWDYLGLFGIIWDRCIIKLTIWDFLFIS